MTVAAAMMVEQVGPGFVAEVRGFQAAVATPADAARLQAAMDRDGVLVLKDQQGLDDEALLAFARLFGPPYRSLAAQRPDIARRLASDDLSDISNLERDGSVLPADDRRRIQQRANLLWHTDNAFRLPAGGYTMLSARTVPAAGGDTEFADMRAAWEALPGERQAQLEGLEVEHSLGRLRRRADTGGVFDAIEDERFPPCVQPLVRANPRTGRKALYFGWTANRVMGWSEADSEALFAELAAHATQPRFCHAHAWALGDLVIWDNTATMHRATPFADTVERRDMRRAATMLTA